MLQEQGIRFFLLTSIYIPVICLLILTHSKYLVPRKIPENHECQNHSEEEFNFFVP